MAAKVERWKIFEKINRFYIGFLKLMSTNLESMHIVKTPIYVLVISSGKVQSLLTYKFEFAHVRDRSVIVFNIY